MLKAQYRYVLQGSGLETITFSEIWNFARPKKSSLLWLRAQNWIRGRVSPRATGPVAWGRQWKCQLHLSWFGARRASGLGLEFCGIFQKFQFSIKFCESSENSAEVSNLEKSIRIIWNEPKSMIMRSQPLGTMVEHTLYRMHFLPVQVLVI